MTKGGNSQSSGNTATEGLHKALLLSYYSLLVFFLLVSLQALESPGISTPVIWLIQVFPLLIFAPGLHSQNSRSLLWLSLVVLLYFMHGVLVSFDSVRRYWGFAEVALCVLLFSLSILRIRAQRNPDRESTTTTAEIE
ncbi:MAG: DUF2069 domain-containing protein [Proteobacteria bacterium]|jgi:uncharacterized membrane protein|nr:DUF2069 domain-containing protein [Pseudomonadota bacterium]